MTSWSDRSALKALRPLEMAAYLRAHGRNLRGYVSGRTVAERFDYRYKEAELEEIAERVERLSEAVGETHVIFNNCHANYGTTNAREMARLLEELHRHRAGRQVRDRDTDRTT